MPDLNEDSVGLPDLSRDSAGITISLTPGVDALSPLGWEVDPVPHVSLGDGDSTIEQFHEVAGLKALPDGKVLVVDGGSAELRFFGPQGHPAKREGGTGEGPGEFEAPVLVPWVGIDSLLVFDRRLQRFQVFPHDGQASRTIRPRSWPGARPPVGAVDSRVLVEVSSYSVATETGPVDAPFSYRWIDLTTGNQLEVESFTVRRRFSLVSAGRRTRSRLIPFSSEPTAATTEQGALITDGHSYEIREYDVEGHLRRIIRVRESAHAVTEEMIETQVTLEAARSPASRADLAETYAEMPLPDSLPVFRSLKVDEMGWIWAELYAIDPSEPKEWMVFDLDRRARGIVRTPPGLEVESVGGDFLLGVWRDEFEVEHVRWHALDRGDTGAAVMKKEPPKTKQHR